MIRKEDIATFSLYQLGGGKSSIHIEDIAHKCHELAKPQFSWLLPKYQEYPDIKAVYYALDAVSRGDSGKYVNKISDRSKGGQRYQLTRSGVLWIKKNKDRLAHELKTDKVDAPRNEVQCFLRDKKKDSAFKRYKQNKPLSIFEVVDFLGCSFETSPTAIREKFKNMEAQAELANDQEIVDFLAVARNKFTNILGSKS